MEHRYEIETGIGWLGSSMVQEAHRMAAMNGIMQRLC